MAERRPEIADDGFEWAEQYILTWARYQRYPGLKLSAPSRAPGFLTDITGGYRDEEEDNEIVGWDRAIEVIDGVLDDCSELERCAMLHIHLYAVFRFERVSVVEIYQRVRQKIAIKLKASSFY